MSKITKKQQVLNHFLKHPLATPRVVSEKYGMALPAVYTLRKQAMHEYQERNATEILGPQIDEPQVVVGQAKDRQVGGDHYKSMGVQPWDVVDTWPIEQQIGYYRGNALKYIMRMGAKDTAKQEAGKAGHYVQKLVEVLEAWEMKDGEV